MTLADKKNEKETPPSRIGNRKPYFCPFCRALYVNKEGYATEGRTPRKYKCLICNSQAFDHRAYKEQQDNGQNYHIKGDADKEKVTLFIKQSVMNLKKEGYTHREIQEITHFSRSMINNITKIHSKSDKSMSLKEFLTDHLLVSRDNALKIIDGKEIAKDEESESIFQAIKYGCSYDVISKLFHVSRRDVSTASGKYKEQASPQDKKSTDAFKKNYTVILEDDVVIIRYKKKN